MARKPARTTKRAEVAKQHVDAEGRAWFDEQGHLVQTGPVPMSKFVSALLEQTKLFLSRLESCERTDTGDYRLRDSRAGELGGIRVLWRRVVSLAQAITSKTLPPLTPAQQGKLERDGIVCTRTGPTLNHRPLADAMAQLTFAILTNPDGSWVNVIPAATVAKVRALADELPLHLTMLERAEGGGSKRTDKVGSDAPNDDAMLSAADLAEMFDVDLDPLRKRLERWRSRNDDAWTESANPKSRAPKFLYRLGSMRPVVAALKPSARSSVKRPSTK